MRPTGHLRTSVLYMDILIGESACGLTNSVNRITALAQSSSSIISFPISFNPFPPTKNPIASSLTPIPLSPIGIPSPIMALLSIGTVTLGESGTRLVLMTSPNTISLSDCAALALTAFTAFAAATDVSCSRFRWIYLCHMSHKSCSATGVLTMRYPALSPDSYDPSNAYPPL